MSIKKNLAYRLRERQETIEYRKIRTQLQAIAQNKDAKQEYRVMHLENETIIQLQNEGIKIVEVVEFGYKKLLLTWSLNDEERLAEKIKWVVDFNERHISVPQKEQMVAEADPIVRELRNRGFHIQLSVA